MTAGLAETTEDGADLDSELLRRAQGAAVYAVAEETPLQAAPILSARLGVRVLLKREDYQPGFSFKLRGAYNRMASLDEAERAAGVVAASAGNHAQGVALAAARLGVRAAIVMPAGAPQVKVDAVRRLGGSFVEVVLCGETYDDAQTKAETLRAERDAVFVHPFDDLHVIAGQATVGLELLRQAPPSLQAVFVPIGGGGLAAGMATVIKSCRPRVQVIGVQSRRADAMARSLEAGYRVTLDEVDSFADGTAVKRPGRRTFALCQRHLDGIERVDTRAVCAAIGDVHRDSRSVPEPSGALALAGLKQYAARNPECTGALAAVVSGANMNFERLGFVAGQEAALAEPA